MSSHPSLVDIIPAAVECMRVIHEGYSAVLYIEQDEKEAGVFTLRNPERGVSLRLQPVPDCSELIFAEIFSLDLPLPQDVDLVYLALLCNSAAAQQQFTFGVDAVLRLVSTESEEVAPQDLAHFWGDLMVDAWRDVEREYMRQYVPGVELEHWGGSVPFQAWGTWDGHPFCFKYRGGWATLSIAAQNDDPVFTPGWRASTAYGDTWGGSLEFTEFVSLFCYLRSQLQRAPFHYDFPVLAKSESVESEYLLSLDQVSAWGHSPQEAYRTLASREHYNGLDIDPTPLNKDRRSFPDKDPDFFVEPEAASRGATLPLLAKDER